MADIELVIKIDEEDYKKVLDTNNRECEWNNMHRCYEVILNGTPLPKGHGRLIDADELIKDRVENDNIVILVNTAQTIIEADKAESEEQTE